MTSTGRDAQPALVGPRVRLRPWRAGDAPAVLAACQDPEIQRWTQVPVPYRAEHAEGFVGDVAPQTWAEGGALFAVEPLDGGDLVGSMGLFPPEHGVAEAGYWTAPAHRGRGLTAEALGVLTDWALAPAGGHRVELHRVELLVDPANTGSRRVAEAAGFTAEGTIRRRFLHRGRPSDVILYARLTGDARGGATGG
ncbi:GNAT family N-acetyltransferase [Blastococcus xanthinilyticus]|uniref:RimJ/RimL family protein N-acetyltransferase n=1 Tax=Blastococcus xanthinilyticus TaxID=1564164 RepID=A0A5S5D1A8_9ACTN|nr:GNAT family N-acetyltransferase [Blastococcus xanthinilyticus]TYP89823.1 RimJ/RimL family protein N-acetyltransferase [Blastococcus xanthinilyticus]